MERKGDRGVDGGKGRKLEAGPGLGDGMCWGGGRTGVETCDVRVVGMESGEKGIGCSGL